MKVVSVYLDVWRWRNYGRNAPSIDSTGSRRLLGVVRDVWADAIDRATKMVVSTLDDIPLGHIGFEGVVDHHKASMEEAAAEVTKEVTLRVLARACGSG